MHMVTERNIWAAAPLLLLLLGCADGFSLGLSVPASHAFQHQSRIRRTAIRTLPKPRPISTVTGKRHAGLDRPRERARGQDGSPVLARKRVTAIDLVGEHQDAGTSAVVFSFLCGQRRGMTRETPGSTGW